MTSQRSYDIAVAATWVKKDAAPYKELKRLARRANRETGEPISNFAVIWLSGSRPVFRFFSERAAQQFRANAPAGSLS